VALEHAIAEQCARLSGAALVERLDRADIANGPMNTVRQFADHPQLAARGRWRDVDSPAGPVRALVQPAVAATDETVMGPIPGVGEHTRRILAELAIDRATVDAWFEQGIV
jgi:itaconate CoA-transferase